MIYLKSFNESVTKDIVPITHTEYRDLMDRSVKIEKKEISKLEDFFKQYPTTKVKMSFFKNSHLDIHRGSEGQWLLIYKLDDYYWLVYASTNKNKFLKIDDWEALMRFLEQHCSKLKKVEKTFEGIFDFKKKEFKKLSGDILFKKVDNNDDLTNYFERIDFSKKEIDYLNSLSEIYVRNPIKDYKVQLNGKVKETAKFRANQEDIRRGLPNVVEKKVVNWYELESGRGDEYRVSFYKYDDNWYYVTYFKVNNSRSNQLLWKDNYKCDTFDGVKQLMEFLYIS